VAPVSVDVQQVAELAAADPKTARKLLEAQQAHDAAAAKIAAADADAQRRLYIAQKRRELATEQRRDRALAHDEAQQHRDRRRERRLERRRDRARRWRTRLGGRVGYLRTHADDAYAAVMYALAVGGAIYGQITAATARGWPLYAGIVIAAAIEGLALVMALTAQKLRLAGEAARAPRILTWVCAGTAATINYLGHAHASRVGALLLAALSLAGIVVWEIRSGAAHRIQLRAQGLLPEPPAAFGWRRWWRYPTSTFAAWSIDVRDRVSPRATLLLNTAATEAHQRQTAAEQDRRDRRAAAAHARTVRLTRRAVRSAHRRKDSPAVLAALRQLAEHHGCRPVLTSTGPAPASLGRPPDGVLARADLGADWASRTANRAGPGSGPQLRDRTRIRLAAAGRGRGPRLRPRRSRPAPELSETGAPALRPAGQTAVQVQATRPWASTAESEAGSVAPPSSRTGAAGRPGQAGGRNAGRSSPGGPGRGRSSTGRGSDRERQPLDVADLLPAGRQVRAQLAADGVGLSRSVLIKALREREIGISTDRATALLAALRRDPESADRSR
jgi:hypothetical protein